MKYQNEAYSCGAAATVNALRAVGIFVTENDVRKHSYTLPDGTDSHGIVSAVRALGSDGKEFKIRNGKDTVQMIRKSLRDGLSVIISVQFDQHWTTLVGLSGTNFVMVDPARTVRNKRENGVHVLTDAQLMKLMRTRDGYYNWIIIGNKKNQFRCTS